MAPAILLYRLTHNSYSTSGFRGLRPTVGIGAPFAIGTSEPGSAGIGVQLPPKAGSRALGAGIRAREDMMKRHVTFATWGFLLVWLGIGALAPVSVHAQARAAGEAKVTAGAPININTATAEQLDRLPGIGPKTAAAILDLRQKLGGFKKVEDLMSVRGIGEKTFIKIRPLITITVKTGTGGSQ